MELAARRQPPTVRLRRLAAELRDLRNAAGLTREDVAEQTGMNAATLYRIETAKVRPQRRTLVALLDLYQVRDETRRLDLIALSRQAAQLGWLQAFDSELPEEYTTLISFEAEARSVRNYESLFVPGLLQTEDYARAVIAGVLPLAPSENVERRAEARMKRQQLLTKKNPLKLWAIVDEAVLHRQVGGPHIMAAQLGRFVEASAQPHITLQVLPYRIGAHPGMTGSFATLDFPDPADPELVYVETMAGDLFLERAPDVQRYSIIFEHLRAVALSPADSVQLISQIAKAMEEGKEV